MDSTTKMKVDQMIKQGWYRKSETLGEGGWARIHASDIDWKTYALFEEDADGYFQEVEVINAADDETALKAFARLYRMDEFIYWEIQERIVEYRMVGMKKEEN